MTLNSREEVSEPTRIKCKVCRHVDPYTIARHDAELEVTDAACAEIVRRGVLKDDQLGPVNLNSEEPDRLPTHQIVNRKDVQRAAVSLNRGRGRPLQPDGETLDLTCKDYDLLERKHKQEPVHPDQQDHYEAGWEAAVKYYFG